MAGTVHTDAYKHLLALLVSARTDAKLSQALLAERIGKPASFVGKYELGERRLDVIELLVVLNALGIEQDEFIVTLAPHIPDTL